jgi:hypothetical protein
MGSRIPVALALAIVVCSMWEGLQRMLLLLEDNAERVERFTAVLRRFDTAMPQRVWRNAHDMLREVGPLLPATKLLSLDHDLERENGSADPGDGLMVAKFLIKQPIIRPIIIHSSNTERSVWMAGEFELAGWPFDLVAPLGDDWIEIEWYKKVERLLKRSR